MTQRARNRQYYSELGGALVLYTVVLVIALAAGQRMPAGWARTLAYASPMLPFLLAVWAVVRQIRRSDEFVRKVTLEHLAVAAAVTAGWTFTYGFLENAGLPAAQHVHRMAGDGRRLGRADVPRRPQAPMNNRLRELRAARGWSQAALADLLDVSRQTVNAIETGRYDPSLPLAFAIARVFGTTIEAIFVADE